MSAPRSDSHGSWPGRLRAFFTFRRVFYLGIIFKGLDGLGELLVGLALVFVSPDQIRELVALATRGELSEDPHDFTSNLLVHSTARISHGTTTFLMIYLFIHATVKLVSVFGILRGHRWAYPFALIALGLLTLYQVYDIAVKPTAGIILLTVLDIVIIGLIWREYRNIRSGQIPPMLDPRGSRG